MVYGKCINHGMDRWNEADRRSKLTGRWYNHIISEGRRRGGEFGTGKGRHRFHPQPAVGHRDPARRSSRGEPPQGTPRRRLRHPRLSRFRTPLHDTLAGQGRAHLLGGVAGVRTRRRRRIVPVRRAASDTPAHTGRRGREGGVGGCVANHVREFVAVSRAAGAACGNYLRRVYNRGRRDGHDGHSRSKVRQAVGFAIPSRAPISVRPATVLHQQRTGVEHPRGHCQISRSDLQRPNDHVPVRVEQAVAKPVPESRGGTHVAGPDPIPGREYRSTEDSTATGGFRVDFGLVQTPGSLGCR
mmetsp:Transcript_14062/g.34053  ORF Transcript_14062/g.34053 Transcript_14062/m.34053 type:complete len:299 (+) Transcript_14062:1241-2137(+)